MKRRVLYLTRGFGDYILELTNAVSRYADPLLVLAERDEWIASHLAEGVRSSKSGAKRVRNPSNIISTLRVDRLIKQFKPDIIHFQSRLIWESLLIRLNPRIPFVVTAHDIRKHPRRGRFLPQCVLDYLPQRADGIIVHGRRLLEQARDYYGVSEDLISFIPMGIMSKYGTGRASVVARNKSILLFGSLDSWKGIEYLVQAEPLVRERIPEARIIIAGKTRHPGYYRNLVNGCPGIELRIGFQDDKAVKELFGWADVLVLPYIEASQSAVLQVGFGFGVPAVVTDVGALPEVVRHEQNGLVTAPRDPVSLADSLVRLLSDTALREKVIDSIVVDRQTLHSWDSLARSTVAFYEQCIERRARKEFRR